MRSKIFILSLLSLCTAVYGADTLSVSLEECRTMALFNNKQAQIDEEKLAAADYTRKAALASMFPKFSANAAYMYNTGEVHLIPNTTDLGFGTVTAYNELGHSKFAFSETGAWNELRNSLQTTPVVGSDIRTVESRIGQVIADGYQELYDRLSPDLTHVLIGQVGVVQPIYMGGKLREMYRIAQAAQRMIEIGQERNNDEIIRKVDEAYWRVVLITRQKQLAEDYLALLTQLESDVNIAAAAGLATGSDMLNIRVKKGEAEQKVTEASNGLELSRMALSEVCGRDMETIIIPTTDVLDIVTTEKSADITDARTAATKDNDLLILAELEKIAHSQARIASAGLQPNIVASANYIYTNPNVQDGFNNDWHGRGFFTVGVALNMPIAHADDIMRLKAAKHTARVAELKREEAEQLVTLRDRQREQRLIEARQRLLVARTALENAKENLRYAEELYNAGMITASELLQQQTAWLAAETDIIDAAVQLRNAQTEMRH